MAKTVWRVTAPYITVKVETTGGVQVRGYTADMLLPSGVLEESIRHHARKKMIEEVRVGDSAPEFTPGPMPVHAEQAAGRQASVEPEPDPDVPPPSVTTGRTPPPESGAGSSKAAWVDFAVASGFDREQAEGMSRDDLIKKLRPAE